MNQIESKIILNEIVMKGQNIDSVSKLPIRYPYRKLKREIILPNQKKQLKQTEIKDNVKNFNKILACDGYNSYFGNLPIRIMSKSQYRDIGKPETQRIQSINQDNHLNLNEKNQKFSSTHKQKNLYSASHNIFFKKKCNCGQCQQCTKNFLSYLKMFSDDDNLPTVSAKSWSLWKKQKGKYVYIYGKRPYKQRQIASLTKILVSIIIAQRMKKWNFNQSRIYIQIPKYVVDIKGTIANLRVGQLMNITDLLYGLMLPSGNDAAIVLSQKIGLLIYLQSRRRLKLFDVYNYESFKEYESKSYGCYFVNAMNQKCKQLGLNNTFFHNPHGNDAFQQYKNVSNSYQVAKICFQITQNNYLLNIVNTKFYKEWINTNKLLWEGFQGIKTGITETAGPCLVALYQDILVVVLNCKSMQQRWIEVKRLVKWVKSRK